MPARSATAKSGVSSRLGFGCMILFALPFAGGGLLALFQGIHQYGTKPDAIVAIIVGGVFTLVGLLLMVLAAYGASASAKTDALKAQNPDKPWMWRDDWAHGTIKDSNKTRMIGIWVFTVIWNAISFPVALLMRPQLTKDNLPALLILLFPLAGIILLITAVYQTLRSIKFGTSTCRLERVPIAPGGAFRGDIELNTDDIPENGYRLRIASLNAVTTRTGKNRSTTERLLWDSEIVVNASSAMRSPEGTRVPFKFATPPDSHVTEDTDSYNRYLWRLSASAEFPGVDYAAQFEIPVFRTGEQVDASEYAAFAQHHRAAAARQPIGATAGVEITAMPGGGEQFRIHARKTFGSVFRSLLFLAIWNVAIGVMIHFHVPWGIPAVFIALDLLFIISMIDYFLGRSTVTVDKTGVRVRKEWLGAGSTTTYEAAKIASIDGTTAGQNSTSFGVTLKLSDGSTQLLGAYLPDRESADVVAAKMMADLGRA